MYADLARRIAAVAVAVAGGIQLLDSPIDWSDPKLWAGLVMVAVPAFYSSSDKIGVRKNVNKKDTN